MKTTVKFLALARLNLAVLLLVLTALPAFAGTATWGGLGADANWATGANWSGGSASGAAAAGCGRWRHLVLCRHDADVSSEQYDCRHQLRGH